MTSARPLQRVCFQLQVKPDRIEAYREAHAAVWPDMLRGTGCDGLAQLLALPCADGLLIGYFETPAFEQRSRGWR